MLTGLPTRIEPKITIVPPEILMPAILTKIGFDSPPAEPLRRRQRHVERRVPRELREIRRSMTYHWF